MAGSRCFGRRSGVSWSLISLVVQPGYALVREGLRHLGERVIPYGTAPRTRRALSAGATTVAGLLVCVLALWLVSLALVTDAMGREHLGSAPAPTPDFAHARQQRSCSSVCSWL